MNVKSKLETTVIIIKVLRNENKKIYIDEIESLKEEENKFFSHFQ